MCCSYLGWLLFVGSIPTCGCMFSFETCIFDAIHVILPFFCLSVSLYHQPSTIVLPYDRSPQNGANSSMWVYRLERRK